MQRTKSNSTNSTVSPSKSEKGQPAFEVDNTSIVDLKEKKVNEEKAEEKGINIEEVTEEGIKSVINFLKDKIPGLKVKVMNVDVSAEALEDGDSVKQLMQESNDKTDSDDSTEEASDVDEIQPDEVTLRADSNKSEDEKDLDMKLFIGGVVHNNEDIPTKDEYVRHPAEIKDMERDSFMLYIPGRSVDLDTKENKVSKVKVAALAAQGVSELMPPDVAKAFWNSDKVSSKVRFN